MVALCHSCNEHDSRGKNSQTRKSFVREFFIWRVQVSPLTCLATCHIKTRKNDRQSGEYACGIHMTCEELRVNYHNYLFYQKDTARPLSRLLIHTQLKKKNPEEDE